MDVKTLERKFAQGLRDEVTLLIFVEEGSAASKDVELLARALAGMSPKIRVETELVEGGTNQRMKDMRIEHWPCIVLLKGDFTRIRYYGAPSGYETPAFADAIVELSAGAPHLAHPARENLAKTKRKANIKVFVLTTCPFCATVARHSYRAAIGSPLVTAEVIDSSVFLDLAARHSVMGVPKMILNGSMDITGAVDEVAFFEKLRDADHALLDGMYG